MRGSVQGYPILFTTDTGASKTILSNRIFESMKPEGIPNLVKTSKLVGASGVSIQERGKGTFNIKLGPVEQEIEAIVAEIDDDGLLGVDILQNGKNGPADLLMSKGVMVLIKKEIPMMQVGMSSRVRKVNAADHFVIPAQSECIVDVVVERHEYDDFSRENDFLVEPSEHFLEEYPLHMPSTLVNINRTNTCEVRLVNPFQTKMSIKQDAVIGRAEPVERKPVVIEDKEDETKALSYTRVRWVKPIKEVVSEATVCRTVKESDNSASPDPLNTGFRKTTYSLNETAKERVVQQLSKVGNTFSKGKGQISAIKTKDAAPIKQDTRQVTHACTIDEKNSKAALAGKRSKAHNHVKVAFHRCEEGGVLQLNSTGKERPIHHSKLKPYEKDNPPRWIMKAKRKLSRHPKSQ